MKQTLCDHCGGIIVDVEGAQTWGATIANWWGRSASPIPTSSTYDLHEECAKKVMEFISGGPMT